MKQWRDPQSKLDVRLIQEVSSKEHDKQSKTYRTQRKSVSFSVFAMLVC